MYIAQNTLLWFGLCASRSGTCSHLFVCYPIHAKAFGSFPGCSIFGLLVLRSLCVISESLEEDKIER
ncbi:uncharacterized protein G2W53_018577 [Senna tora]|uniref:Uncharacterized protein n=1 Tax=Senna tora TaxID=362788 RepID=A0A834TS24_9FABA|nr:uncharacterized protein G2W53_018577 [Senna tora]